MSKRFINDPYSRFSNKDKDYVSAKINFDKSISIDFFSIVLSGDINKLNQYIGNKGNIINLLNEDGVNALHIILNTDLSELTKLNVIKYLLSKKILIEVKNKMGETPLSIATKNNYKNIIIELIKAGANIQNEDSLGITPLHYLARGLIVECEKSYIENIIDDPKPKHDKKVISELALSIKKFYNENLLKSWSSDLNNIMNIGGVGPQYNQRLISYFKHIESAVLKVLENDDILNQHSVSIANDIKKIALDITLSDEEKKYQLEKVRTDYYNKVYKVIKSFDYKFDVNIDLTPTYHIDNDGLFLANKDGAYSNHPKDAAAPFNYGPKDNTTYYKVNGEATLNQQLKENENRNNENLIILKNDLLTNFNKLNEELGIGIKNSGDKLAEFILTARFNREIWRFNEFIKNNRKGGWIIFNPANSLNQNNDDFDVKRQDESGILKNPNGFGPGSKFHRNYFMEYGAGPPAAPFNIDVQTDHTNNNQFNEHILTKYTIGNNRHELNEEITIDLTNFNWRHGFGANGNHGQHPSITLGIHNKTTRTTTYISKDYVYNGNDSNWAQDDSLDGGTQHSLFSWNEYSIYAIGPGAPPVTRNFNGTPLPLQIQGRGRNVPLFLNKLLKFKIKKNDDNSLNLILEYVGINGQNIEEQRSYNFGNGQFTIGFDIINIDGTGWNNPNIVLGPSKRQTFYFDLTDSVFTANNPINLLDIRSNIDNRYFNFFDGHNLVGLAQRLFILTPLFTVIDSIKTNSDALKTIIQDLINDNLVINPNVDVQINLFIWKFYNFYIRYFKMLTQYYQEDIRNTINATIIEGLLSEAPYRSEQDQLYNQLFNNLNSNKSVLNDIDTEINSLGQNINNILGIIERFITITNENISTSQIYEYFNKNNETFELVNDMTINLDDFKNMKDFVNEIHFSGANNKKLILGNPLPVQEIADNLVKSGQYFIKYNNIITYYVKVQVIPDNNIGINFLVPGGAPANNFTKVEYNPRILKGYFYLTRYRMIEELILDLHFYNNPDFRPIYDKVEKYVKDNLGQIKPVMERPMILSIIGDLIDNYLISNVKKSVKDAVTKLVNQQISPNMGTQPIPTNAIPFIVQSTNPTTGPGDVEINYSAVDFDVEFGLNLGEQDELVEKALSKINTLTIDKLLNLSFGDMLLSNKVKQKYELGDENSSDIQQIFYPTDFLSSLNSEPKCTIYDTEIVTTLDNIKTPINLNHKDYYGNSPLYYAINSQNYLFAEMLIKKNARILNIQNKDEQNPFVYILDKIDGICNFFDKENNLLFEFNKYYTIGLKEDIIKIDNHRNIMQNIDKLVLLYLFLLNSSFFNEMYAKDYDLLKLLKELHEKFNLLSDDSNIQKDFNNIFINPLHKRHLNSANSTSLEIQDRDLKFDVIINLQNELNKKLLKKEKKKVMLQNKINNYTSIQTLLQPTDISYATNIQENVNEIQNEINKMTPIMEDIQSKLNKITTDIAYPGNTNFGKQKMEFTDLFEQIFEISKTYNSNKLKDFSYRPFLKALYEVSQDKDYYNNTYFFHHLISKAICQFVNESKDIMNQKLITSSQLVPIKEKLHVIIEIMKKTMYKKIFYKNNNIKNIDKNTELLNEFNRICFTVDIVVGNTFFKVLKRLIMTFIKTRYPVSNENADDYLLFIKQKTDVILSRVDIYIQPNYNSTYKPSELTKKMVLLNGNYKSTKYEYSTTDENTLFEHIPNIIKNNGFEEIESKEPIIRYIEKIFLPYFINYYRICISRLSNVNNSYENYILNQYHNLNMFKLLLDNLFTQINGTANIDEANSLLQSI
jgi:ankyrin repeat protein